MLVAGLIYGNRMAVALALADLGVSYIAATVQMAAPSRRMVALVLLALSIVLGVSAGLYLVL